MVSLSLLKYLENNGFGKIDENLFWEKMGLEDGLYISDLGGNQDRGRRPSMTYSIYSRAKNDVKAYEQLVDVVRFLKSSFGSCELPAVPPVIDYGYKNVVIMPPSPIVSVGQDTNGRMIYSITGQIYLGERVYANPPVYHLVTEGGWNIWTEDNQIIRMEDATI